MIKEYRKKTNIKAEQFDGSPEMIKKYKLVKNVIYEGDYALPRLYGPITIVRKGDWIITNAEGGYQRVADGIFQHTYEEVR